MPELADEDETAAAAVARTLDDLAAFVDFALPLIDLLAGWPSAADHLARATRLPGDAHALCVVHAAPSRPKPLISRKEHMRTIVSNRQY